MRTRLLCFVVLSGAIAGGSAPVAAHHSAAATYRLDQQITIDGLLVKVIYRNPHAHFEVEAPDGSGRMRVWLVECGSPNELHKQSFTEATLKPGDRVIVTGDPARDMAQRRLRLRSVVRPSDGWHWSEPAERGVGRGGPTSAEPRPGGGTPE